MRFLVGVCTLAAFIYGGGGVTKTGIEQFWTDDYKIFEQIYGKTSDKNIYGTSLPSSVTYGGDRMKQASEKKERYPLTYDLDEDISDASESSDTSHFFDSLIPKKNLKSLSKKKPATSTVNFVSYSDFKPISQTSDPETYSYLKHLEELNNDQKFETPNTVGGFKPYVNYVGPDPEDSDAYKSIQNILDAHEANNANSYNLNDDNVKYLTYGKSKKKKPARTHNGYTKPRCSSTRCRKRGSASIRVRSRPYVRRIKHRVVKY